jgi:DNA-binding NtrC family response regulator
MPYALIVGKDSSDTTMLLNYVAAEGFVTLHAANLRQAKLQLALHRVDIIFVNLQLADGCGLELFSDLDETIPWQLVVMAQEPSIETAIEALRLGAADYLTHPINFQYIKKLLARVGRQADKKIETSARKSREGQKQALSMLGISPVLQTLRHQIDRVAPTEATVLLLGESGTGKELVAQTIHANSLRHKQPFLPVNCGAISPQLIESEIFGHEKGSFTGADRQHKGYFERASGGSLFLDEVIEMPIELQVKLLRVLETGTFMRIGSNQEIATDVRIIAATNRNPESAISEGRLRLDLYHRLNVFPLKIPALRDRGQDIELLAQYFLDEFNTLYGTEKILSNITRTALCSYHWPGNVRELRNFIQRAYILSDQVIDTTLLESGLEPHLASPFTLAIPVGTSLADVDRKLIFATLDLCDGVKKRAADVLGISLKTLYNRLDEYGGHGKDKKNGDTIVMPTVPLTMPSYDGSFLN